MTKKPLKVDKRKFLKGRIHITRTEQWEWTASYRGLTATGSTQHSAELNLLRKLVFGSSAHEAIHESITY